MTSPQPQPETWLDMTPADFDTDPTYLQAALFADTSPDKTGTPSLFDTDELPLF
jgi:hypothetical protein